VNVITFCYESIRLWMRMTRVSVQLLYGFWRISSVPRPIVSFFGGARPENVDPYFRKALALSSRLVASGVSVLTGGGSGIMEAASCGIREEEDKVDPKHLGRSIGIGVKDLGEGSNPCVQEYFELDYFFARKWLLTRYSDAIFVFPGGFGTLDELAETLTLIQTGKIPVVPIILIGSEYWEPFMHWLVKEALHHGMVNKTEVDLFKVTDDLDEAYGWACAACHDAMQAKKSKGR